MRTRMRTVPATLAALGLAIGAAHAAAGGAAGGPPAVKPALTQYTEVTLTSDLSVLSEKERKMIPLLIDACRAMDEIFWLQSFGDRKKLLDGISDPVLRLHAERNYGPWDRLQGNRPFIPGAGEKPKGAGYYPADMTAAEFEKAVAESPERAAALKSEYTVVRRDRAGKLVAVPFRETYAEHVKRAAGKLREAAALAEDAGLARYLGLRADALLTDRYRESDLAWMDMKTNAVDVVIGPIEHYEDQLFGSKTAHEGFVLIKDKEWSARLARYAKLLPALQKGLPVPDAYKKEEPGTDSDLNAYDAIFYAGDCNAGSKVIAINLPNDETVQIEKGTRRLQLKNAMRAKFDKILLPIADRLIAADQRKHVKFDAFFSNVMFHEVAHGLGIKKTLSGKGSVREALKDVNGALEEGKADVLGLYMVTRLQEMGELGDKAGAAKPDLMDNYVTFLAGLFRSVRFGAASAHGRANLAQFEFLKEHGAFSRDEAAGTYRVDFAKMKMALDALAEKILRLQGDGDYAGTGVFLPGESAMDPSLKTALAGLASADIPVDIAFRQGMEFLKP